MSVLEIQEMKIKVPASWDDITLQQQINFERYAQANTGFTSIAMVAGYCDLKMDDVKHFNINNIKDLLNQLSFVSKPMPQVPIHEFEHRGHKYFTIPSMLKGEFQDFISNETILDQYKRRISESLSFSIAILCKREGETLDKYDVHERAKEFYDLPLPIAQGLSTFFLTSAKLLNLDYNSVLENQHTNLLQLIDYTQILLKPHRGMAWRSRLLTGILRYYLKFIKLRWNKYYSIFKSGQPRMTLTQRLKGFIKMKWIRSFRKNNQKVNNNDN